MVSVTGVAVLLITLAVLEFPAREGIASEKPARSRTALLLTETASRVPQGGTAEQLDGAAVDRGCPAVGAGAGKYLGAGAVDGQADRAGAVLDDAGEGRRCARWQRKRQRRGRGHAVGHHAAAAQGPDAQRIAAEVQDPAAADRRRRGSPQGKGIARPQRAAADRGRARVAVGVVGNAEDLDARR